MPLSIKPDNILEIAPERDQFHNETSDERFDRMAFAHRALEIVRPPRTTVAICPDARRLRVEQGPSWRRPGEAWALLAIPRNASRRAIALAVAELSHVPRAWAMDVLFGTGSDP